MLTNKTTKTPPASKCSKTLTGNIKIIRTLNKFAYGVSYLQLEEDDTALCLQKIATGFDERVVLPTSMKHHVSTNLA